TRARLPPPWRTPAADDRLPGGQPDHRDPEPVGRTHRRLRPAPGPRGDGGPAPRLGVRGGAYPPADPRRGVLLVPGDRVRSSPPRERRHMRPGSAPQPMDLSYSPDERACQREVRAWLKRNVPKLERSDNPAEGAPDKERIARAKAWQRKVHAAGYLAMGWPKEYGGQGADVMR